ncbi:hypothetical protein MYCTH_2312859 [Thermothelomyces thermophilus ATCC 42464]|uniref:Uncharacterized protein n=1 Tax=Thermothelomyces thermophilus (strain ATCC 42464 / BCRC 31852 / DSM 1799) TaxID=573729 RepID=G2QNC0_THET4|nr:uncharacterized protein MYCTH_2312859 [Thermothelomyces thermophilus ATCC 42464]AEO61993.1 hypothetical protein MYCTH_2312859 [Thermothelomyces thermophilus ATCC 42464]
MSLVPAALSGGKLSVPVKGGCGGRSWDEVSEGRLAKESVGDMAPVVMVVVVVVMMMVVAVVVVVDVVNLANEAVKRKMRDGDLSCILRGVFLWDEYSVFSLLKRGLSATKCDPKEGVVR